MERFIGIPINIRTWWNEVPGIPGPKRSEVL